MSFYSLLHHLGHGYVGKIPKLAMDMQKNPASLSNKLNPNNNDAHPNPNEIEEMVDLAQANGEVARYFADKAGMLLIPMVMMDGSDVELLDGTAELMKEIGDFFGEFQRSYADGRIDSTEWLKISKEGKDVMAKMACLMNRIEQMVDDKPARKGREG